MVITPETNLRLLKCPLELNQNQQLNFTNTTQQTNYFASLPYLKFDDFDFTYVRKDGYLRLPAVADSIYQYNYVMYQNKAFDNKWFYAAITHVEFVSPNCTHAYIKTDVWQTWQFNLQMKQCFVEREHVADDTPGRHTVPENVELGEMVQNAGSVSLSKATQINIIFQVSEVIDSLGASSQWQGGGLYSGIYSGLTMFAVGSYTDAQKVIQLYQAGKESAIVAIFYAPINAIPSNTTSTTTNGATIKWINPTNNALAFDRKSINQPGYLGGQSMAHYVPKNNKLLTYPYCYLRVTNNVGQDAEYRYEDFTNRTPTFDGSIVLSQGCSVYMKPINYLGSSSGAGVRDYGLTGGKFPILGWATDYYTNWETQNAVNLPLQTVNAGLGAIGSMLSQNIEGVISGLGNMIGGAVAQVYEAKLHPDQARGNSNCGDINWAEGYTCFELIPMSIKYEYAQIIDEYFSMFGYKVNRVKTPQWTSRPRWNYIKTIGVSFECDCPQEDAAEIQSLFNNGFTVWHSPEYFGDYNASNK